MKFLKSKSLIFLIIIFSFVSAIDWCEDIEAGEKANDKAGLPANPLKGTKKCRRKDQINVSGGATLPIKNRPDLCNFFTKLNSLQAPWPKNC